MSYYERNPELRTAAVRVHGTRCQVCGMGFAEVYGPLGADFIEVHHRKPVSEYDGEVQVDPAADMAAVCPNCHRMLHCGPAGPLTVEELRARLEERRQREGGRLWSTSRRSE
ncbi:MAG: HNH endonuclease [Armatimonadota bacterium]